MKQFKAKATGNLWEDRLLRLFERLILNACDLERALEWYVGGGRRYFTRYATQIAQGHKWCFIVGCNNSGTSLLHSVLGKSGQVSTLPLEGQRYTTTLRRATKRGYGLIWSEYIDELKLQAGDPVSFAARLLHDWMRDLETPIREVIVEKTPANAVRMTWLEDVFPRSYFIGVVRNGYAVTEGIHRKSKHSLKRGARHWNLVNKLMMQGAADVDRFLELRYEDLVGEPVETARRVGSFIGIGSDSLEKALTDEYSFTTVLGSDRQPVRNLNAESLSRLTASEHQIIYAEAVEMLDFFNYTSDSIGTAERSRSPYPRFETSAIK